MLGEPFKSRLSKLSSKKEGDQVVQEFVLTYVSMDTVQMFLQSLDEKYELFLRHAFITNTINWKSIVYDINIPFLDIEFDALKMTATLVGISITRKATNEGEVFKYNLVFQKEHDPAIDSVFAITFLNRKEENEDGKKVFLEYDTTITPLSGVQIKVMEDEKEDENPVDVSREDLMKEIEGTMEEITAKIPEELLEKIEEEIPDKVPEELLKNTEEEIPDKVLEELMKNTKPPESSDTDIPGSIEELLDNSEEKAEEEFPE